MAMTDDEDLPIHVTKAGRDPLLNGGEKPPCAATIVRWTGPGKKGRSGKTVRLGTVLTGRSGVYTTRKLIRKFYDELNAPATKPVDCDRPLPGHDEAERQLDEWGVGKCEGRNL